MSNKIRKFIELDQEDVAWIETNYPRLYWSSLFSMMLKAFIKVHRIVPADLALIGAKELKRMVEGEEEEDGSDATS